MSVVTNVLINTRLEGQDEPLLQTINAWLAQDRDGRGHGRNMVWSTDSRICDQSWYGGTTSMDADIWAGAVNLLDVPGFLVMLRLLPWANPEDVQIFIKEQDDTRFTLYTVASPE